MVRVFIICITLLATYTANAATECDAGKWLDYTICQSCNTWGNYTSDGGTGGITSCYTTCDDGARAYWPNTCTATTCAVGSYLSADGKCTACENGYYCLGDNTHIACSNTLPTGSSQPSQVYTLLDGFSYARSYGRSSSDCYCRWDFFSEDETYHNSFIVNVCFMGPATQSRVEENDCNTGYYATGYYSGNYTKCKPCNNAPENAAYIGYGSASHTELTVTNCPWVCNDGYGRTADDTCAQLCTAGFTTLRTSIDIVVPVFHDKHTSPAIHIKHSDTICYADLVPGTTTNAIHVNYNGQTYHTVN